MVNSTPSSPKAAPSSASAPAPAVVKPESIVSETKEEVIATPVEAIKTFDPIQGYNFSKETIEISIKYLIQNFLDEPEAPITYVEPVSPVVAPPPVVAEVAPTPPVVEPVAPVPSQLENSFTPSEPVACDLSQAYPQGFPPAEPVAPTPPVVEPVAPEPVAPPTPVVPVTPVMQQQPEPVPAPVEPEPVA